MKKAPLFALITISILLMSVFSAQALVTSLNVTEVGGTYSNTRLYNSNTSLGLDPLAHLLFDFEDIQGTSVKDLSFYNNNGTITNAVNNADGTMTFDGDGDYITIPADTAFLSGLEEKGITIMTRVNHSSVGTRQSYVAFDGTFSERNYEFFTPTGSPSYLISNNTDSFSGHTSLGITTNAYQWISGIYHSPAVEGTSLVELLIENNTSSTEYVTDIEFRGTDNIRAINNDLFIGSFASTTSYFNGSMDFVAIYGAALDNETREDIINEGNLHLFKTIGNFTSDFFQYMDDIHKRVDNLTISCHMADTALKNVGSCDDYVDVYVSNSSDSATIDTRKKANLTNGVYVVEGGLKGSIYKFEFVHNTDNNNTPFQHIEWNVSSSPYLTPEVQNLTTQPTNATEDDNIIGNATYIVDSTEIGAIYFEWFVNNSSTYNETVSGLLNGSIAQSTFDSSYFVANQTVKFSATPENTFVVNGTAVNSTEITILDSPVVVVVADSSGSSSGSSGSAEALCPDGQELQEGECVDTTEEETQDEAAAVSGVISFIDGITGTNVASSVSDSVKGTVGKITNLFDGYDVALAIFSLMILLSIFGVILYLFGIDEDKNKTRGRQ